MKLKEDEIFALNVLIDSLGGSYHAGEDPPDAYLEMGENKIAVEVTQLIEPAYQDDGSINPRIKEEAVAERIGEKIKRDYSGRIQTKQSLLIEFSVPVTNSRKSERELRNELDKLIDVIHAEALQAPYDVKINDNVAISFYEYDKEVSAERRIEYFIFNGKVSDDIVENVKTTLAERINDKKTKIKDNHEGSEYWLLLLSNVWLADRNTYDLAYAEASLSHDFDKIYVVLSGKRLHRLFPKDEANSMGSLIK